MKIELILQLFQKFENACYFIEDTECWSAREKLSKTENKLSGIIYERGVDEKGFVIIRSEGDKALFGGRSTQDMKCKLTVPKHRPPKTLKKWNAASKLRKRKPCKNPIK